MNQINILKKKTRPEYDNYGCPWITYYNMTFTLFPSKWPVLEITTDTSYGDVTITAQTRQFGNVKIVEEIRNKSFYPEFPLALFKDTIEKYLGNLTEQELAKLIDNKIKQIKKQKKNDS